MKQEVRYQLLRPRQIIERRSKFPIVYIPIGTLEWHGLHNPVGADTIQAEGLAIRAAEIGGGLVFPPLYYGESRIESLMEANADDHEAIAELMALPASNFSSDRMPHSAMAQTDNYQQMLIHILAEAMSLGFQVGVLVAGHYPLIDHARSAVLRFNKWRTARYGGMLAWACVDYQLVRDRWPEAGDHAGGWETSHLLHLRPHSVDLTELPSEGTPLVGVGGSMPPQRSTAEFGRLTLEAAAEILVLEATHRLNHREFYMGHGDSLREKAWQQA